ncbi:hypothetical protein OHU34_05145 [Streptomyces sp. NBC_00080]|uniref:hypothetical protein n=1 Tax=Streptomyces TaxID=1883 RepID=UPI001E6567FC|nr:hypothetical protein [Streptomyces coriariae]
MRSEPPRRLRTGPGRRPAGVTARRTMATPPHPVPETTPDAEPARPPRSARRRLLVPVLVAVLLTQTAVAMVTTAVRRTPTIDEPVYVAAAAGCLHEHRVRLNPEHPPLGKLVVAVGRCADGEHPRWWGR